MRFFSSIISGILFISLTGCGFHLRGPQPLPAALHQLVLLPDAVYTPLQREMTNQLALAHCTVVDAATKEVPRLTFLGDSYSNITLSVGSDGQAREKLLVYTLSYQLANAQGNIVVEPNRVRLNRVVKYDPNFVLAKGYEEDKMIHNMRIDAVAQIINQLSHITDAQLMATTSPLATPDDHSVTENADTQSPDRDIMPTIDTDIVAD